jgi:hypothetical protein
MLFKENIDNFSADGVGNTISVKAARATHPVLKHVISHFFSSKVTGPNAVLSFDAHMHDGTWADSGMAPVNIRGSGSGTLSRIEIYLENLDQFFNSMDPSPFHEKDLDDDAEEFIVSWAEEFQFNDPIVLVIHLSRYPTNIDPQQVVEKAVHNHFAYKVRLNRLQFKSICK